MVSSKGTLRRRRLFQCRHIARSAVSTAVGDLGFVAAQLANGLCGDRRLGVYLGCPVVDVLPFTKRALVDGRPGTLLHSKRPGAGKKFSRWREKASDGPKNLNRTEVLGNRRSPVPRRTCLANL